MFNLRKYILLLVFIIAISSSAFAKNKKNDINMESILADADYKATMATIYLHRSHHTLSDFKRSFSDALFAATNGNAKGQYALAMFYDRLYSTGDDKSGIECLYWLHKSADQGCPDAIAELGYFYTIGRHVEKDPEKGFNLIKESASDKYREETLRNHAFKGYYYLSLC